MHLLRRINSAMEINLSSREKSSRDFCVDPKALSVQFSGFSQKLHKTKIDCNSPVQICEQGFLEQIECFLMALLLQKD